MRFVAAKTRAAPLKKQSIPRLELLSAVLLARLMGMMRCCLGPEMEIYSYQNNASLIPKFLFAGFVMWSGHGNHSCKTGFQKSEACSQWSVGNTYQALKILWTYHLEELHLLVNKLWRDGPEVSIGVPGEFDDNVPQECLEELRASEKQSVHSLLANEEAAHGVRNLVEIHNFSSLSKLVNVLTNVMKFCSNLRRKATSSTAFYGCEESLLIREAQHSLKTHKNNPMWEKQLSLFADDSGILRCGGRIGNASTLPYANQAPCHPAWGPLPHNIVYSPSSCSNTPQWS
jgi:hypothetical protein